MTSEEINTIREIVRSEVDEMVGQHLLGFAQACMGPLIEAVGGLQEAMTEVSRGQTLVERSLLDREDDDEPWRASLDD